MSASSSPAVSCKRLEGKVAIVTGGASGIGEATVKLFSENGAKVIIADIQDELGRAMADKLGPDVCYIHCDVTREEEVRNLVDSAIARFKKLDIMYNNAGVYQRGLGSILDADVSELDHVLKVNLIGSFLGAKYAAKVMVPKGKGCILFTASCASAVGGVASHSYTASKHALLGLAKSLTAELGEHGVRVNCISPSGVLPSQASADYGLPLYLSFMDATANLRGQILRPEDIAKAALYLASDEASYVSGLNLLVDGGVSVVNPLIRQFSKKFQAR